MSTQRERSEAAAELGKKGGAMNIKKHGKKRMSQIGKLGAKKRWANNKKQNDESTPAE